MRQLLVVALLLSAVSVISAQPSGTYSSLIEKAASQYKEKQYSGSLETYQKAFKVRNTNTLDLYNAACVAALLNDNRIAFKYLFRALDLGLNNLEHLRKNEALANLKKSAKWEKVLQRSAQNKDLRAEHYYIAKRLTEFMLKGDKQNTLRMASDEFRLAKSVDSLDLLVTRLKLFLERNDLADLKNFFPMTSDNRKMINGVTKRELLYRYKYTPLFFGKNTKTIGFTPGAVLTLKMEEVDREWRLTDLSFEENKLSPSFDWRSHLSESMQTLKRMDRKIHLRKMTEGKFQKTSVPVDSIAETLINALTLLRYTDVTEEIFISENGFALSTMPPLSLAEDQGMEDFFKGAFGAKNNELEFFFSPDSNKIIVSTILKYGVYIDEEDVITKLITLIEDNMKSQ